MIVPIAYFLILGAAIFSLITAVKHSARVLSWSCLDSPAGQVLLRWVPILLGATTGPVVWLDLPEPVAAMLGGLAGAHSRAIYRAARQVAGQRLHALLATSEARSVHGEGS